MWGLLNSLCDSVSRTFKMHNLGAALLARWRRSRLPVQEALIWEDPACCGIMEPVGRGGEPVPQSWCHGNEKPPLQPEKALQR